MIHIVTNSILDRPTNLLLIIGPTDNDDADFDDDKDDKDKSDGYAFRIVIILCKCYQQMEKGSMSLYSTKKWSLASRVSLVSSGVPSTSAARGDDLKCRHFLSPAEKINQYAKISDDLF